MSQTSNELYAAAKPLHEQASKSRKAYLAAKVALEWMENHPKISERWYVVMQACQNEIFEIYSAEADAAETAEELADQAAEAELIAEGKL